MNPCTSRILGSVMLLVVSVLYGPANAEDAASGSLPSPYITPEEMTQADYDLMAEYAYRYEACLNQASLSQIDTQPDVRHAVDYAMKQCAVELEELDQKLTARNIDPTFRLGFIGKINRDATNNTLRNMMMAFAARQSGETGTPP